MAPTNKYFYIFESIAIDAKNPNLMVIYTSNDAEHERVLSFIQLMYDTTQMSSHVPIIDSDEFTGGSYVADVHAVASITKDNLNQYWNTNRISITLWYGNNQTDPIIEIHRHTCPISLSERQFSFNTAFYIHNPTIDRNQICQSIDLVPQTRLPMLEVEYPSVTSQYELEHEFLVTDNGHDLLMIHYSIDAEAFITNFLQDIVIVHSSLKSGMPKHPLMSIQQRVNLPLKTRFHLGHKWRDHECTICVDYLVSIAMIRHKLQSIKPRDNTCCICLESSMTYTCPCGTSFCYQCLERSNRIDICPHCKRQIDAFEFKLWQPSYFDVYLQHQLRDEMKLHERCYECLRSTYEEFKPGCIYELERRARAWFDDECDGLVIPSDRGHQIELLRDFIDLIEKGLKLTCWKTRILVNECHETDAEMNRLLDIVHRMDNWSLAKQHLYDIVYDEDEEDDLHVVAANYADLFDIILSIVNKTELTNVINRCTCGGVIRDYECVSCHKSYCHECCEVIDPESMHICDPEARSSWKEMLKTSTACPTCGTRIQKSEGCADMWCTQCQHGFDYNTGRIKTGDFHNPERGETRNLSLFGMLLELDPDVAADVCEEADLGEKYDYVKNMVYQFSRKGLLRDWAYYFIDDHDLRTLRVICTYHELKPIVVSTLTNVNDYCEDDLRKIDKGLRIMKNMLCDEFVKIC